MKVKKLTDELLKQMLSEQGIKLEKNPVNCILDSKYVANFNRAVGARIISGERKRVSSDNSVLRKKIR